MVEEKRVELPKDYVFAAITINRNIKGRLIPIQKDTKVEIGDWFTVASSGQSGTVEKITEDGYLVKSPCFHSWHQDTGSCDSDIFAGEYILINAFK